MTEHAGDGGDVTEAKVHDMITALSRKLPGMARHAHKHAGDDQGLKAIRDLSNVAGTPLTLHEILAKGNVLNRQT